MGKRDRFSYDDELGRWWLDRRRDAAHRRAYRNIADFIRYSYRGDPGLIVDYACGPGDLLALLSLRFKSSKLVGLDGSSFLLSHARALFELLPQRCARRISLVETPLPNLGVLRGRADLVVYSFPNMIPFSSSVSPLPSLLCENDRRIAKSLSIDADSLDGESPNHGAPANHHVLEQGRSLSLNIRRLLVKEGICVRVEYATMQRHKLSPQELAHVAFEEGSLDASVGGRRPRQWFRLSASAFFRSRVLEDVYEQTGDEKDRNGGYLITVLRAV